MNSHSNWTTDEKDYLLSLVKNNTINNRISWTRISKQIRNRTANQCKTCFYLTLGQKNTESAKQKWTAEESSKLFIYIQTYGTKWILIKQFFPNKTQ